MNNKVGWMVRWLLVMMLIKPLIQHENFQTTFMKYDTFHLILHIYMKFVVESGWPSSVYNILYNLQSYQLYQY